MTTKTTKKNESLSAPTAAELVTHAEEASPGADSESHRRSARAAAAADLSAAAVRLFPPQAASPVSRDTIEQGAFVLTRVRHSAAAPEDAAAIYLQSLEANPSLGAWMRTAEFVDDVAELAASAARPAHFSESYSEAAERARQAARRTYQVLVAQALDSELARDFLAAVDRERRLDAAQVRDEERARDEAERAEAEREAAAEAARQALAEREAAAAAEANALRAQYEAAQQRYRDVQAEALVMRLNALGKADLRVGPNEIYDVAALVRTLPLGADAIMIAKVRHALEREERAS